MSPEERSELKIKIIEEIEVQKKLIPSLTRAPDGHRVSFAGAGNLQGPEGRQPGAEERSRGRIF